MNVSRLEFLLTINIHPSLPLSPDYDAVGDQEISD